METIIGIIVVCLGVWLLITLLPVIFALIFIVIGIALIYGLYVRHKVNKYRNEEGPYEQETTYTYDTRSKSHQNDDIIDVEYTETTEGDR